MSSIRIAIAFALLIGAASVHGATIRVDSTAQEVTVVNNGDSVGGNPSGLSNGNCTLGEAILSVNRRVLVDGCAARDSAGLVIAIPLSGPVTIALAAGVTYTLNQWGTTLYGPTGLPAIGAATEGPFATSALSDIVIEGNGAVIARSAAANTPPFRLLAVAGTMVDQDGVSWQARETNPLLTPAPGHLLSAGRLTVRNLTLQGGFAKGGDTAGRGGGGLGAGGAVFTAGSLVIEQSSLLGNAAQGGGRIGFGQTNAGAGMGADAGALGGGGFGGQGRNGRGGGGTVSNGGLLNGGTVMQAAGFGGGGAGGEFFSDGSARAATPGGFGGGGGASDVDRSGNSASAAQGGFGGGGGGGRSNAANGGFGGGGGSQQFFASSTSRLGGFGASNGTLDAGDNNNGGAGAGLGGAIFSTGQLAIINSTLADNAARGGGAATTAGQQGGSGFGGAIFIRNGSFQLQHATLVANQVAGGGGFLQGFAQAPALYVLGDAASATIRIDNSVLVDSNFVGAAAVFINSIGSGSVMQSNGRNWLTANANGSNALSGDVRTGNPGLGAVALFGLTPIAIPLPTSGLINAALASASTIDQRGFPRPVGVAADLGAVEVPAALVSNSLNAGPGSLRQSLVDAAALGQSELRFADNVRGTIALDTVITLANGVHLIGPGADVLALRPSNFGGLLVNPVGSSARVSGLALRGVISGFNNTDVVLGNQGTLRLEGVHISGNAVTAINNSGDLIVRNSAMTQNVGPISRAVIENAGTLSLINTTLAENSSANAGIVRNAPAGVLKMINSTMARNTNSFPGGDAGLINSGVAQVFNSIISENAGAQITGNALAAISANNLIGVNALTLSPLQNNGGSTPTMAIDGNSPAQDGGSNAQITAANFGAAPFTDQRGTGFDRISGANVDIGAFERVTQPAVASNTTITSVLPAISQPFAPVSVRVAVRRNPPSGAPAAGTVVVRDGPLGDIFTASCRIVLTGSANEVGSCTLQRKRSGSSALLAEYAGAPEVFSSSASANHSVRELVLDPPSADTVRVNQSLSIPVRLDVDAQPGSPAATGSIIVSDGVASCTIALPTALQSCDYRAASLGAKQLTARYSGDSHYPPLVSAAVRLNVGPERYPELISTVAAGTPTPPGFLGGGSAAAQALSADSRFVVYSSGGQIKLLDRRNGQTRTISRAPDGSLGNGESDSAAISADGRFVAFASSASNLVAGDSNAQTDVFLFDQSSQTLRSLSANGNNESAAPSISDDGQFIAFQSFASNLVSGDSNGSTDIFLFDSSLNTRVRVSVGAPGVGGQGLQANGYNIEPSISGDGRWLAFASSASNLAPLPAGPSVGYVILRELSSGTNQLISKAPNGSAANDFSGAPYLNADASVVTFQSSATNLVANDTNGLEDIFAVEIATGAITRINLGIAGAQANGASSQSRLSRDGRFVVFASLASNLVDSDTNNRRDVFLRDRQTASTTRVSVSNSGAQLLNGESNAPALNGNASQVIFGSQSPDANPSGPAGQVYLRDRSQSRTEVLSITRGIVAANGASSEAATTPDGRYVVFTSIANNLAAAANTAPVEHIFRRDNLLQTTVNITGNVFGNSANPSISDDGRFIAFDTTAALVSGDRNNLRDVYIHDMQLGARILASGANGVAGNGISERGDISGDGSVVAFESTANNFGPDDSNGLDDIYAFQRSTGAIHRVSKNRSNETDSDSINPRINFDGTAVVFSSNSKNLPFPPNLQFIAQVYRVRGFSSDFTFRRDLLSQNPGGFYGDRGSFFPVISGDGNTVVFASDATNLLAGDSNKLRDVYLWSTAGLRLISATSAGLGNDDSQFACIAADASVAGFSSRASNLVAGASSGVSQAYTINLVGPGAALAQPTLASRNFAGEPGNGESLTGPHCIASAGFMTLSSSASNLLLGDRNGLSDVFLAELPLPTLAGRTSTEILSDTPDPSSANQSFVVNVQVSRAAALAASITGRVEIIDDRGEGCTAVLSGAGLTAAGACSMASTTPGTRSLSARYVGDALHLASSSAPATHTVTQAALSGFSVIGDSPDPSRLERSVTYSWSLSANRRPDADPIRAVAPTGTVIVKEAPSCAAPALLINHQCSATLPATSCQIAFSTIGIKSTVLCYSGDVSFAPASATESHEVIAATVPVTLAWLRSSQIGDALEVQFATASNLATTGFDLAVIGTGLRPSNASSGAALSAISDLIASEGDASRSQSYQLRGRLLDGDSFYLRSFDSDGGAQSFGPFQAGSTHGSDPAIGELSAAQIRSDWNAVRAELAARPPSVRSVDASTGVYLDVAQLGIQRVSAAQLRQAGFTLLEGVPIAELALSYGLRDAAGVQTQAVPIAISSSDALWNSDDALVFIGEPIDTQTSGTRVYTLNRNPARVARIRQRDAAPGTGAPIRVLTQLRQHRQRLLFSPTSVGDSPWNWLRIAATAAPISRDVVIKLTNALPGSALLKLRVQGGVDHDGAALDHHVQISLNGTQLGALRFDGLRVFEQTLSVPAGVLRAGENTLSLRLPADTGLPSDVVLLEAVGLEANESLSAENGRLELTLPVLGVQSDTLFASGFELAASPSSAAVLALAGLTSDALLLSQNAEQTEQLSGAEMVGDALRFSSTGAARLFASSLSALHTPQLRSVPSVADLQSPAQYLVIAHPSFMDALSPLLAARGARGLTTKLVSTEQVYARYGGEASPAALRDYLALARAQMGTQFVLLVGGDTLDARGFQNSGSVSLVPTDYVQTSQLVRFAPSDAALVDFDQNGVPELAIGRFPVRTQAELAQVLAKTLRTSVGNRALLIGDAPEPGLRFAQINDGLQALLTNFSVRRAERESLTSLQVSQAILDEANQGARLMLYLGHAGPTRWSFDNVLDTATLRSGVLVNNQTLDVLQLACWTNYFIEPSHNSIGHAWLSQSHGARAVLGPSSLTELAHSEALAKLLLVKIDTGMPLGQALLEATQALAIDHPSYRDMLLGMNLLGDPAAK